MRRSILLPLALMLSLALIACGGDSPSDADRGEVDPDDPEAGLETAEGFLKAIHATELNEDVMKTLYDLHRKVKEVDDNPAKALSVFRDTDWNMATYTKAMLKFEALRAALRRGPEKVLKELEDAKQQIAELEQRIGEATGEQKAALEQSLPVAEMMLKGYEENAKGVRKLNDPKYRAFVEKWIQKFEALEQD